MNLSTRGKLFLAGIVTTLAVLLGGGAAYATSDSGPARRGQPCDAAGSYARDKSGDLYRCEQRKDDKCNVWHAAEPKPGNWGQPEPCICPSKSPSPSPSVSKSPSASPSASHSPSASPSKSASTSPSASPSKSSGTSKSVAAAASPSPSSPQPVPVGNTLPVTGGSDTLLLLSVALVLIGSGGLLLVGALARWRRTA